MGLEPLEFNDCRQDSPYFRENLREHEQELDKTNSSIKQLIKEGKALLNAAKNLSKAQRSFSQQLVDFNFETIGSNQTDDEIVIADSLRKFGELIASVEDQRDMMLERAYDQFIVPLENFRKEQIGMAKEEKKKFDKQTDKFYTSLEKNLNLSSKKKEASLQDADASIEMEQRYFIQASVDYVFKLQEVQERKKFEFVETLLGFMYSWLTFYHQGHEVAQDKKPYMTDLQLKLQNTRDRFNSTRKEVENLMHKTKDFEKPSEEQANKEYTKQGYLFIFEKKRGLVGSAWMRTYCMYQKEGKKLLTIPYSQPGAKIQKEELTIVTCIRRATESIDKRFCFDIMTEEKPGVIITLQAVSENDRKLWLEAMDGKEPVYSGIGPARKAEDNNLNDIGFSFIRRCIEAIENRGLTDQGLYRTVGVNSKVTKFLQLGLDRRKADKLNMDDPAECEIKTITSALKNYFRNLPEPLMPFKLYDEFIKAAKLEAKTLRIEDIHSLVHQLPEANFEMLDILVFHLKKVSENNEQNLMTVANLGVCFGPTLVRAEEESMAAIMDIKFCNIVVEILIDQYDKVFKTKPEGVDLYKGTRPLSSPPGIVGGGGAKPLKPRAPDPPGPQEAIPARGRVSPLPVSVSPEVNQSTSPRAKRRPLGMYEPSGATHLGPLGGGAAKGPPPTMVATANSSSSSESISSHSSSNTQHTTSPAAVPKKGHVADTLGRLGGANQQTPPSRPFNNDLDNSGGLSGKGQDESASPSERSVPSPTLYKVRTLYECLGDHDTELSFKPNQIISDVRPSKEPGWLEGTLDGRFGLIPQNYVEYLDEPT